MILLAALLRSLLPLHQFNHPPFDPADTARAVPAEKAQMPAIGNNTYCDMAWGLQRFDRFHRNEGIIASRQDTGRKLDAWHQGQGRRAAIVVEGVGEAAARCGVQVIEEPHAHVPRELHRRQVREIAVPLPSLLDQVAQEKEFIEPVFRLRQ